MRDELAERTGAARGVVHRGAGTKHEPFEPAEQRIARELPARDREVGGDRAIRGAEAPHTIGTETRRLAARVVDEPLELAPHRRALGDEVV